jgi:hypothetical protein
MLEDACNVELDNTIEPFRLWEKIYINFTTFKTVRWVFKMKDWSLIGPTARSYITRHLAFIYEVSTAFIVCSEEAREAVHDLPIPKENIHKVTDELSHEINKAEEYISMLSESFPDIIR